MAVCLIFNYYIRSLTTYVLLAFTCVGKSFSDVEVHGAPPMLLTGKWRGTFEAQNFASRIQCALALGTLLGVIRQQSVESYYHCGVVLIRIVIFTAIIFSGSFFHLDIHFLDIVRWIEVYITVLDQFVLCITVVRTLERTLRQSNGTSQRRHPDTS